MYTALVADDYAENWRSAKRWLEPRGIATLYAESAERALKIFQTRKVDVAVSDFYFGEKKMNGIELLCAIKGQEAFKNIPFILTSYENGVAEAGARLGATSFLSKPLEEGLLLLHVFRALNLPIPP